MKEHLVITAVGDVMLGDHPVRLGSGVRSVIEKRGTEYLFSKVTNFWGDSDIIFGNLEVALSDIDLIPEKIDSIEFRGTPLCVPILKKIGFNVFSFSNNHCMEHGLSAFWETVNLLKENQIFASGIKGINGGCIPYQIEKNSIKVVLLSYSLRPENYYKNGQVPYTLKDEESIIDDIGFFSKKSDFLIVSLHWGEEFMNYPSPSQVLFAHNLVDSGVNLILGHHPHVLQGIERYNNGIIIYSLGNFIFDMWQRKTRETMIFKAKFSKQGIIDISLIPIYINDLFQPDPLNDRFKGIFFQRMEYLNSIINKEYVEININDCRLQNLRGKSNNYKRLANRNQLQHRLENYYYFLSHIRSYKLKIIFKSFFRSFKRRIEDILDISSLVKR